MSIKHERLNLVLKKPKTPSDCAAFNWRTKLTQSLSRIKKKTTAMQPSQQIVKKWHTYSKWFANQTMADYYLKFTARKSRVVCKKRAVKIAIAGIIFMAIQKMVLTATVNYAFTNTHIGVFTGALLFSALSATSQRALIFGLSTLRANPIV